MTKAEKLSVLLAVLLVAVCLLGSFGSAPQGIATERSADAAGIMRGGNIGNAEIDLQSGKINLNTASFDELCLVPGIGEKLAGDIIAWREDNGSFASFEEFVDEIDGIGENNIEGMRIYLSLGDDAS